MMASNAIPEDIKDLYNRGGDGTIGKRQFRTQLINRLFQKHKGGYSMCTDNPTWQNFVQQNDKRYLDAGSKGVPKSVLLWGTFHGNEDAFNQAVAAGEIMFQNGFYHYAQMKQGREKTMSNQLSLDGGKAKLAVEEFSELQGFLDTRPFAKFGEQGWNMAMARTSGSVASSSHGQTSHPQPEVTPFWSSEPESKRLRLTDVDDVSKAQPSKPDVVKWSALEGHIGEAKLAQERLLRDAGRYAAKARESKIETLQDMLKKVMHKCNSNLQELQHCQMWQDCWAWVVIKFLKP